MAGSRKKEHLILYTGLFTLGILVAYFVGRSLPLYGIDTSVYADKVLNTEELLRQTISGDIYRCSLFALGISPYMIASILVQILSALRGSEAKARTSPKKNADLTLFLMFVFAVLLSFSRVQELSFLPTGTYELLAAKVIAGIEMVVGAVLMIWLSSSNK